MDSVILEPKWLRREKVQRASARTLSFGDRHLRPTKICWGLNSNRPILSGTRMVRIAEENQ